MLAWEGFQKLTCTGHSIASARRYGAEQGRPELREAIARTFYGDTGITAGEIFVSDGSKCDIGRLQLMFGSDVSVAVQVWS